MPTRPHFAVSSPVRSAPEAEDLVSAVPTFVRFYRAFQLLDEDGRQVVCEMMSFFDEDSSRAIEREHAAAVVVEALFGES